MVLSMWGDRCACVCVCVVVRVLGRYDPRGLECREMDRGSRGDKRGERERESERARARERERERERALLY